MKSRLVKILCLVLAVAALVIASSTCLSRGGMDDPPSGPTPTPPPEDTGPAQNSGDTEQTIRCNCEPPVGALAPQHANPPPGQINTKTQRDTFVVGTPPMSGDFVAGWGGNIYDLSIKTLTGGYRGTYWVTPEGQFMLNESVVCNLATEYDDDWNKIYTFTLHNYLKWSNGEPLTAADYVAAILTYASPAFAAHGGTSNISDGILGIDEYRTGRVVGYEQATDENGEPLFDENGEAVMAAVRGDPLWFIGGVKLLDEYKFSVTLRADKLPYFWEETWVTFSPIYAAGWFPDNEVLAVNGGVRFARPIDEALGNISATERHAPTVTCGPYRFVSFDGKTATLERNEHFGVCPQGYVPYFEKIVQMEVGGDDAIDMLLRGEIDFAQNIDRAVFDEILSESGDGGDGGGDNGNNGNGGGHQSPIDPADIIGLNLYPRNGFGFLEFALDFGPTQDQNVRHAIAQIVDRETIANSALGGYVAKTDPYGSAFDGPYSPAQWIYQARKNELTEQRILFAHSIANLGGMLDDTEWVFEADGETPFDTERRVADGSYLRHNALGEPLRIVVASDSPAIGGALLEAAVESASYIGMEFIVEQVYFKTLLDHYYFGKTFPDKDRRWHAFQLATDFDLVDDKYWQYHSNLADSYLNANGLRDEEIDRLTVAMRNLDPSQKDEHADLWVEFLVRWQQLLPAFPLYVNEYADAYNSVVTQAPTTAYAGYHDIIMHIAKHG